MIDTKEPISHIQGDSAFRHIISECGADGKVWFDKRFICDYVSHLKYCIEQLAKQYNNDKHGYWIETEYPFGCKQYRCSICQDDDWWNNKFAYGDEKYCPNCGAKME